jgi:alcohol dehydrogenase class IV
MGAQEVIDTIGQLIVDIGLPRNLKIAGADARDFPGLADYALADNCLTTNPRTADRQQIIDVFVHALDR